MKRRGEMAGWAIVAGLGYARAGCGSDYGDGEGTLYAHPTVGTPTGGATAAAAPNPCIDPSGFGGRGCWKCPATNSDELLMACTSSLYETFDNTRRITGFNPSYPKPPLISLGPTPPMYAGAASTVTDPLPPAPACPIATKPHPVMVLGATGFPMDTLAKAMGDDATIFYAEKGSCEGIASMVVNDPKLSGEIVYYDQDGTKNRCTLAQTHPADVAISALFAQSCANEAGLAEPVTLPPEVEDFLGPVNPVMFTTPATSSERVISAEAAYKVFGFGNASGVAPWTDENHIFRRRPSSGNQQTVSLTLGLPAELFRGRDSNGSTNMLHALLDSDSPYTTIGISSSEVVDTNRDVMKSLAYQHYKQPVAFYPDSDPAKLDRKNVRDGHYFMWMPLHVLVRTSAGDPVAIANPVLDPSGIKRAARDAAVKRLVYVMVNRQQPPQASVDLFGALKRTGNVPQCAMHVKRAREGAPLEPSTPPVACDCAFEAALPGTTRPDCQPCRDNSQCASPKSCSFGYCE
jgi:hypothetical protein